jgi:hypothetical protein
MVGATSAAGMDSAHPLCMRTFRPASPRHDVTASTSEALSTSGENVRTGIVSRGRQGGP